MAQYKVPQNVEAEDKILGPLSLKQFIYAIIGVAWGGLTYAILKNVVILWVFIGLPPMLALVGIGLYQRQDQPVEAYLVSVINFWFRPRTRIWQKEPIADAFHLQPPPPKPELARAQTFSEVRSQLEKLADIVDTRGWVAKRPELQEPTAATLLDLKDRLGGATVPQLPQLQPEVTESDDILGDTAKNESLNVLMENSVKSIRQEAMTKMKTGPSRATPAPPPKPKAPQSVSGMTASPSGDIVKLATEGGDLTVAQIAQQAKRYEQLQEGESVNLRHASAI